MYAASPRPARIASRAAGVHVVVCILDTWSIRIGRMMRRAKAMATTSMASRPTMCVPAGGKWPLCVFTYARISGGKSASAPSMAARHPASAVAAEPPWQMASSSRPAYRGGAPAGTGGRQAAMVVLTTCWGGGRHRGDDDGGGSGDRGRACVLHCEECVRHHIGEVGSGRVHWVGSRGLRRVMGEPFTALLVTKVDRNGEITRLCVCVLGYFGGPW